MLLRSKVAAVAILAVVVFAGSAAMADHHPQWTYVEAGYLDVDVDNAADSGSNWFLGGSLGLGKSWHIGLEYLDGELTPSDDQTRWQLGGGWNGGLGEKADFFVDLLWLDQELEHAGMLGTTTVDDDGWGSSLGVRWRVIPLLEVDGIINYVDLSDAGDSTGYELRGIINLGRFGIGAAYEWVDADLSDADQWNVFLRFNFK